MSYADDRHSSMDLPPREWGPCTTTFSPIRPLFGFARGLAEELLEAHESDGVEDDEDRDDVRRGDLHDAHVSAYRHVKAREARAAALQRGAEAFGQEVCGSSGSLGHAAWGYSTDFLHPKHMWAEHMWSEDWEPMAEDGEPVTEPYRRGYPYCTVPWMYAPKSGEPSLCQQAGRSHDLVRFRLYRAEAMVGLQIAEAGGIDDDLGWGVPHDILRRRAAFLPDWRKGLYLTDDERSTAKKTARKAKKAAHQRTARAQAKKAPTAPTVPPVGRSGKRTKRPIEVIGDHATVPLTRGYVARIPASDVALVEGYNWSVRIVEGRAPVAVHNAKGEDGKARSAFMHLIDGMAGPVEIIPPPALRHVPQGALGGQGGRTGEADLRRQEDRKAMGCD
ncbi:hypothetical protein [Xanthobacter versatilis]|uniref:hypothetical protein n=1 Tax=Xanthobacter autotrophicus (strain ATCC BAA-1158 / Py2) TaxID=78245 RepID=UPI0037277C1B